MFVERPPSADGSGTDRRPVLDRDVIAERGRRTKEYGYRVCGLWTGDLLDGRPRVCVMPRGHQTSPHRDAAGEDLIAERPLVWPGD